eukprot:m.355957 g.355957  ORF g.355957 m.355957 type:complete len:333 (+) comp17395_c0_seq1:315-1313(+)
MAKREMYKYKAPWNIYGLNWSHKASKPFRLAIGSFVEEYSNRVQIVQLNESGGEFTVHSTMEHPYPTTKIMWMPEESDERPDLLATTGDYLRIWKVEEESTKMESLLNNNKSSEFCAPLTSFDWNTIDPSLIVTSSIDTTCTVWSLQAEREVGRVSGTVKTQLIAHDQEVYDVAFCRSTSLFASVGADGSVRLFDLRNLEHSTIVYEDGDATPLLRLAVNKQDSNYIAVMRMDDASVTLLDIRVPCVPAAKLTSHEAACNGIAWAPHSSCHICTAADDKRALIWDVSQIPKRQPEPILAYEAGGPINQVQWSTQAPDWIAIAYDDTLEVLRV